MRRLIFVSLLDVDSHRPTVDSSDKSTAGKSGGCWRELVCFRVRSSVRSSREAKPVAELSAAKRVVESGSSETTFTACRIMRKTVDGSVSLAVLEGLPRWLAQETT